MAKKKTATEEAGPGAFNRQQEELDAQPSRKAPDDDAPSKGHAPNKKRGDVRLSVEREMPTATDEDKAAEMNRRLEAESWTGDFDAEEVRRKREKPRTTGGGRGDRTPSLSFHDTLKRLFEVKALIEKNGSVEEFRDKLYDIEQVEEAAGGRLALKEAVEALFKLEQGKD